jgi:Tol biopolymer transport system component
MSNKFLMLLVILSLSLTAFLAGYLISHKDFTGQPANLGADNILNKFDEKQAQRESAPKDLVALSKGAVISPTLSKEKDSVIYYDQKDGRVFQVNPVDLKEKLISGTLLSNLVKTVWSPNKKEVVSIFYGSDGERFRYFNYQTRKVVDLGALVRSATFSPDGSRLAYFRSQAQNGTIYVSAPDGDAPKKIIDTRLSELDLYWPSQDMLAFKTEIEGRDNIFILSTTGSLTKLLDADGQIDSLWSPDGKKLLYSVKEENQTMLYVKDIPSMTTQSLEVSTTASRCAWSIDGSYVICSIPRSGSGGEDIYKIGANGTKELIASPKKSIVVKQLMLTALEEFIIMVSDLDGKVYSLKRP